MPGKGGLGWNIEDVIGSLGDALSVGAGGKANYYDQVQNDRYGAGLGQFLGGDTAGGLQALASAGGAKNVNDFYGDYGLNQYRQRSADNVAEDNRRQAQVEAEKRDANTEYRLAGMFRGAKADDWQQRYDQAKAYAQLRGYDLSRLNVPPQYKDGWSTQLDEQLMKPNESADNAENRRYHDIANANTDATRLVTALLGKGRILSGISADENRNDRSDKRVKVQEAAEQGRNNRASAAEGGRNQRAINAIRARIVKDNPGAMTQTSSLGRIRYSTDGGKTWHMGN